MNQSQQRYFRSMVENRWLQNAIDVLFNVVRANPLIYKEFTERGADVFPRLITLYEKWTRDGGGPHCERFPLDDEDMGSLALWMLKRQNVDKFRGWVEDIDTPFALLYLGWSERENLIAQLRWVLQCGQDLSDMND